MATVVVAGAAAVDAGKHQAAQVGERLVGSGHILVADRCGTSAGRETLAIDACDGPYLSGLDCAQAVVGFVGRDLGQVGFADARDHELTRCQTVVAGPPAVVAIGKCGAVDGDQVSGELFITRLVTSVKFLDDGLFVFLIFPARQAEHGVSLSRSFKVPCCICSPFKCCCVLRKTCVHLQP